MPNLLIVESPTKVKTIKRILGNTFTVKATKGHIKDLPKNKLGVDLSNFFPNYQLIPGKEKIVRDIKRSSKSAKKVLIATDPDREGEAIAWHVREEIGDKDKCLRVLIHEITEKGIKEAIKNPGPLNENRFLAQRARRVLDRLVGYLISPLLWEKVKRGLSAGRVQSVAVRLICEREKRIREFVPEKFWEITGVFRVDGEVFEASYKNKVKDEKEVEIILRKAKDAKFKIKDVKIKKVKSSLVPPFITSTLQQEAYKRFRFSPKKTMILAQKLYEGVDIKGKGTTGLITYMRTDSLRLSDEAVSKARSIIESMFGSDFLPRRKNVFKNKKGSQDAHEAIRPTHPELTPESLKNKIDTDLLKLYDLIWKRFISSQMLPPEFEELTFNVEGGKDLIFKAKFKKMVFPGYSVLYSTDEEKGEKLPDVREGSTVILEDVKAQEKSTKPPPRYTPGTLVKVLEEKGIGRPSTYATIVSTIQERGYVEVEGGHLKPTLLGEVVNDLLVKHFPTIMDVKFTAQMEEKLDLIEEGKESWEDMIREFYQILKEDLEKAKGLMENLKTKGLKTDIKCRVCGEKMVVRFGKNGPFLVCSRYPQCTGKGEITVDEDGNLKLKEERHVERVCKVCGAPLVEKRGRFGRFLACSKYPNCKYTEPYPIGVKCPKCGGEILERVSKKGKIFYACSNYPECDFSSWDRPTEKTCPMCGGTLFVRGSKNSKEYLFCATCRKRIKTTCLG